MVLKLFKRFSAFLLCLFIFMPSSTVLASAKNGYYYKDTGVDFAFFDAMAEYGTPAIDGKIGEGEWNDELSRCMYKYDRDDNRIRYMFKYDASNFYIIVEVDDDKLWDDSPGEGPYPISQTNNDDGIEIYIDGNNSRESGVQPEDRLLAFTIQGNNYRYDKGANGSSAFFAEINSVRQATQNNGFTYGSATTLNATLSFAVGIQGSINNNEDTDKGYVAEIAIPWIHLGVSPIALSYISLNILVLEDDDGGYLSNVINSEALDEPMEIDRYFKWFDDGLLGPENYARILFLPPNDTVAPSAISDLSIAKTGSGSDYIQPRSVVLSFTAPGDNDMSGQTIKYNIRYSINPIITESDWNAAQIYENAFMPRRGGKTENLRVLGLEPATLYYIAVRSVDYAGNQGPISSVGVTTSSLPDQTYGKGRIYPSPNGRYFVHEDGTPFFPVPNPIGITWLNTRDLYKGNLLDPVDDGDPNLVNWSEVSWEQGNTEKFIQSLAEKKINLVRLFIEDMCLVDNNPFVPDGVAYLEFPATPLGDHYLPETLQFLDDFMSLCAKYGIYVVITPWDDFYYREDNFDANPHNIANGGTISNRDEFVTNSDARAAQKQRLTKLHSIISKYNNFFGWEMMNEWDNIFAMRDDGIGTWIPLRIEWMKDLVTHLRTIDPEHMISISSVIEQPQFELKDFVLQSDLFDFIAIHNYIAAVCDPTKSGDSDVSILPAHDSSRLLRYMIGNTLDYRPIYDLESGPFDQGNGTYNDPEYQQPQDEETFHNIIWSEFGSGLAGSGVRWPSEVLSDQGPALTDQMNTYLTNMALFYETTQLDFASFQAIPWERYISFNENGSNLIVSACGDGEHGIIYLLQDTRKTSSTVSDLSMTVSNVTDGEYRVEIWDTRSAEPEMQTLSAVASNETLSIALDSFTKDQFIAFSRITGDTAIDPAKPISSQSVYTDGDQLIVTLPEDTGKDRYVAIAFGEYLWIMTDLNTLETFSLTLPVWKGGVDVLNLSVSGLPSGTYIVFLLEAPIGSVNPLSEGTLGSTSFSIN